MTFFHDPIEILVNWSQQLTFFWMASASAAPSSFQSTSDDCFAVQLIFANLQGGSEEFAGIILFFCECVSKHEFLTDTIGLEGYNYSCIDEEWLNILTLFYHHTWKWMRVMSNDRTNSCNL